MKEPATQSATQASSLWGIIAGALSSLCYLGPSAAARHLRALLHFVALFPTSYHARYISETELP